MGFSLLQALEPISGIVPEIVRPALQPTKTMKTAYTAIALFIYLVCSQVPLYGAQRFQSNDPLFWTRQILASNRGTLMQLGIGPIISASWAIQLLTAFGVLKVRSDKDKNILQGFQKTLALIMCIGEAAGSIWYGSYGSPSQIGIVNIMLIMGQLLFSGFVVILLDSMLKAGYGLGSGVSLFIVVNTSEHIFWSLFSPVTYSTQYGVEFQGSFICLTHFLLTKPNKWTAVYMAFTRTSNPNLLSFFGTVIIFFIVIYLQGFQIKIPLIHQQHRGYKNEMPIKLFYTSNMSAILLSMIVSNFYMVSRVLAQKFSKVILINLLGKFQNGQIVGGLVWYISPPPSFQDFLMYPYRFVTYVIFVSAACAFLSRFWIEITKETPRAIAIQIRNQNLTLPSYRTESVYEVLNKYIPTAAMLGGIIIGLLNILGNIMNITGSSTGILLSVSILYKFYQKIKA